MSKKTYLMFGGVYPVAGAKYLAGITALRARSYAGAVVEADDLTYEANADFPGTWSGGYDLYEVEAPRKLKAGPLVSTAAASLDDLPKGARFLKRFHRGSYWAATEHAL